MIGGVEFRLGCRGLLYLARFDAQFLRHFDRSPAGALRSFWLALPILPFALFVYWREMDEAVPSAALYMTARCVGYAYSWILFPMIILIAGRLLGRDAEAPATIAVYNWFSLIWVALQAPVAILFAINPTSAMAALLGIGALIYSIVVEVFLLARCLRIQMWQSAILVAIDLALSLYVDRIMSGVQVHAISVDAGTAPRAWVSPAPQVPL